MSITSSITTLFSWLLVLHSTSDEAAGDGAASIAGDEAAVKIGDEVASDGAAGIAGDEAAVIMG